MESVNKLGQHAERSSYLYVVEPTDNGYSAFVPDVPGVVVAGSTEGEVEKLLSDALCLQFLDMVEDNESIPSAVTKQYVDKELDNYKVGFVSPSAPDKVSLEIGSLVKSSGLKYAEVARRMDVPRSILSRLTSPIYHGHSMETLRKLAHSLGYEVEVSFKHVG